MSPAPDISFPSARSSSSWRAFPSGGFGWFRSITRIRRRFCAGAILPWLALPAAMSAQVPTDPAQQPQPQQRVMRQPRPYPNPPQAPAAVNPAVPNAAVMNPAMMNQGAVVGGAEGLDRIAGKWIGIAHSYPSLIYIEMTLTPNGAGLEGDMKFQPMEERWKNLSIDTSMRSGSSRVSVRFDNRTDAFGLTMVRSQGPGQNYNQINLNGVLGNTDGILDERGAMLVGRTGGMGIRDYYVFTRPEKFPALEQVFRKFEQQQGPGARRTPTGPLGRALGSLGGGGGPSKSDLLRWIQPLEKEYPRVDVYQTAHGVLENYLINLFEDKYFSSFFGANFDDLSVNQLTDLAQGFRPNPQDRTEMKLLAMVDMFSPMLGTHRARQTTLWVIAFRSLRAWRDVQLEKLGKVEAVERSFAVVQGLSDQLTARTKDTLWPSEQAKNEEVVLACRRRIAGPALDQKMRELESGPGDRAKLLKLASWSNDNAPILAYVDESLKSSLAQRADARVDRILADLMPAEMQRVRSLGAGLKAVEAGSAWYAHFKSDYVMQMNRPPCLEVFRALQERRKTDLAGVADEMVALVRGPYDHIPNDVTPEAERARLSYCNQLVDQLNRWFAVPGDNDTETSRTVLAVVAEVGGHARRFLAPSKRGLVRFAVADNSATRATVGNNERDRAPVSWFVLLNAWDADEDRKARSFIPAPIVDAGVEFTTDLCWNIFHGRFDQIESGGNLRSDGLGTQMAKQIRNTNPQFHYAFVSFVGLSSKKYGDQQIGPSTTVFWTTTVNGQPVETDQYPVRISKVFVDYYESSYKIAETAADVDGVFGNNIFGYMETVGNVMKGGLFSRSGERPDGKVSFVQATWERPILSDLTALLDTWPARSVGVWQFHENLRRYLKGLKSLQALFVDARNENRWNDLHVAARLGDVPTVRKLAGHGIPIESQDQAGRTAMHHAAMSDSADVIDALAKAGANVNATALGDKTPLHLAAIMNARGSIIRLLADKAIVDSRDEKGVTPLQYAAESDDAKMIQALLDAGANPALTDAAGLNALHHAAERGSAVGIKTLAGHRGVNVQAKTKTGWTALHMAAKGDRADAIGELVAKGIDVNAKTLEGFTPLHVAAISGSMYVVEPLIIRGADVQARDMAGKTPLDQAIANNNDAMIRLLRKLAANGH